MVESNKAIKRNKGDAPVMQNGYVGEYKVAPTYGYDTADKASSVHSKRGSSRSSGGPKDNARLGHNLQKDMDELNRMKSGK